MAHPPKSFYVAATPAVWTFFIGETLAGADLEYTTICRFAVRRRSTEISHYASREASKEKYATNQGHQNRHGGDDNTLDGKIVGGKNPSKNILNQGEDFSSSCFESRHRLFDGLFFEFARWLAVVDWSPGLG